MKRASAPGYDLFKLVVTLILIALLVWLWPCDHRRGPKYDAPPPTSPVTAQPTETIALTPTVSATATATPTSPAPTPTASATAQTPAATPTSVASPTPGTDNTSCATSVASRLQVGTQAKVLSNLNMRVEPSINADILKTNLTGTRVDVIDGPVCTPQGSGAYLWWRIRLSDGREGWSAETALIQKIYFLEPVP